MADEPDELIQNGIVGIPHVGVWPLKATIGV
jgi:hypothetical protein